MRYDDALNYTRQNTGKHFMDSGGETGRLWQQPAPAEGAVTCPSEDRETSWLDECSINLTQLLADLFTQEELTDADGDVISGLTIGSGVEIMEQAGYELITRANTYNGENDLDQDFIYEIWARPGAEHPAGWCYASSDDAVVVIYVHTGADIRGGYSDGLIGQFEGEYVIPFDLNLEYVAEAWHDDDDEEEAAAEDLNGDGQLSCGYSGSPSHHATSGLGLKVKGWVAERRGYHVVDEDGNHLLLRPERPYYGE